MRGDGKEVEREADAEILRKTGGKKKIRRRIYPGIHLQKKRETKRSEERKVDCLKGDAAEHEWLRIYLFVFMSSSSFAWGNRNDPQESGEENKREKREFPATLE